MITAILSLYGCVCVCVRAYQMSEKQGDMQAVTLTGEL